MGSSSDSPFHFDSAWPLAVGRSTCPESCWCNSTWSPSPKSFWSAWGGSASCWSLFDLSFCDRMEHRETDFLRASPIQWTQGILCLDSSWIHRILNSGKFLSAAVRLQIDHLQTGCPWYRQLCFVGCWWKTSFHPKWALLAATCSQHFLLIRFRRLACQLCSITFFAQVLVSWLTKWSLDSTQCSWCSCHRWCNQRDLFAKPWMGRRVLARAWPRCDFWSSRDSCSSEKPYPDWETEQ